MLNIGASKKRNLTPWLFIIFLGLAALLLLLRSCNPAPVAYTAPVLAAAATNLDGKKVGDTITLSGTGMPGSTVEIVQDGKTIGTAVVDKDGNWSYPGFVVPDSPEWNITLNTLDRNGKAVATSNPFKFALPVVALAAPGFDLPDLSKAKAGDKITLSGTGTPGSKVQITQDGKVIGTADVGPDGKWSFPGFTLPNLPEWNLGFDALGADGKVAASADPVKLALPALALAAPGFDLPDLGKAKAGDKITLSGTGTPGSKVQITQDGKVIGTADVGADGKWSFPDFTLPNLPEWKLGFDALGADGKIAASADPVKLALPALALAAPAFDLPELGNAKAGDKITLSGTGTPGSKVQITQDGKVIGTADVGADGKWSFPDFTLPNLPEWKLGFDALGADGKIAASADPVKLALPGVAAAPFAFTLPDWGKLKTGDKVDLTGTGNPGDEVDVMVDGKSVGKAKVGADGTWKFPFTLPKFPFKLSFNTTGADGKAMAAGDPIEVAAPTVALGAPTLDKPDLAGAKPGGKFTLSGTATPNSMVDVLVNGKSVGKAKVGADGKWSLPVTLPTGNGFEVTLNALDANGKVAANSTPAQFSYPVALTAPTLVLPAKVWAVGAKEVSGKASSNAPVEVLVDGVVVGTTKADANGDWKLSVDVPAGKHNFVAQTPNGAKALASAVQSALVVDMPTIDALKDPRAGYVNFTGTGTPGSIVDVLVDGVSVGKTKVGASGKWSLPARLTAGAHKIAVNVVDPANVTLLSSSETAVTVAEGVAGGGCNGRGTDMGAVWSVNGCDTLSQISKDTGIPLGDLINSNPQIEDPNLIVPGELVNLPGRDGATPAP